MKHPACEGCEFDGKCLTEKLYEADCPEVQNYEKENKQVKTVVYSRNKPMSEKRLKQFENRKKKFALLRKQTEGK